MLDQLLGMLGGMPTAFDVKASEQAFVDKTAAVILSGMAKAGDKPETIKKNVKTATEYAKVILENSKVAFEEARKEQKIASMQKRVEEARNVLAETQNVLATETARITELERVRSQSLLWRQAFAEAENRRQSVSLCKRKRRNAA